MNNIKSAPKQKGIESNSEYQMTFQDYLVLIKIHYKIILLFSTIGLLIGLYKNFNAIPNYISTASVVLREAKASNLIMDLSGQRKNKIINEIQLIKSRSLAKRVVETLWNSNRRNNLHIFETRIFYPKGQRIRNIFKTIISFGRFDPLAIVKNEFNEPYSDAIGERFATKLLGSLEVKNVRSTNILNLSYRSINADESARITNIIAKTYVQLNAEQNKSNAKYLVRFLDSLVSEKQKEIYIEDEKIRDFKLDNNMYSLDGDAIGIATQINNYESESYNMIAEINVRKEKIDLLQSKLNEEEKYLKEKLKSNINNQLISLRFEISRLESQIIQNKQQYGENHAAVKELKIKLVSFKKELDKQVSNLIKSGVSFEDPIESRQKLISNILSLEAELIGFELRNIEIKKMLDLFNQKLILLPKKQMELASMIRDSEILGENYGFLRKKYEEAKLNVAIQTGEAFLLDNAKYPKLPTGVDPKRVLLLYTVIFLGISLVIIFILEIIDNTLKTIDEIEKYNLPILGIIPAIGKEEKKSKIIDYFKKILNFEKESKTNVKRKLMMKEDPKSPISEAYRGLRTSMLFSTEKKIKTIVVSSAGPGEGKTTTVANLAISYAKLGKKTLLIDTDLRRPVVDKVFDLPREPGITNFITSQTDDFKSLIKKTEIENLSVITSGLIPPNPSEILGSSRMTKLVKKLEDNFDMILFDSPPLVAVTDANMISRDMDQIVIVVKVGQTDKKAFHHTISNLHNINAPLGGIIMNAVTNKTSYGSYYYYYQQYYHYYGSDES